jgi:hypothetical protein
MILNMNQLRAFYAAAKSMSITRTADELMVTLPAITSANYYRGLRRPLCLQSRQSLPFMLAVLAYGFPL